MLYHAAKAGAFGIDNMLMETLMCMLLAGADVIVTCFALKVLDLRQAGFGRPLKSP